MTREPAVAGYFYPDKRDSLLMEMDRMVNLRAAKKKAHAVIAPHAGIMYSGNVAGDVFSAVKIPDRVIIIGPNHRGTGSFIAAYPGGKWSIPTGEIMVDEELVNLITSKSKLIEIDAAAHAGEHSIEVQLPFLRYINPNVKITPVVIGGGQRQAISYENPLDIYMDVAHAISDVTAGMDVLIIASSDMTHFETEQTARKLDNMAIKEIMDMNPKGLYNTVRKKGITMCGVVPAVIAIEIALQKGAKTADIIKYCTSGETSGDYNNVVGYLGVLFL